MKHIVITGSTRGIGFGLAKRFIERDCKVTINGTSEAHVRSAIEELKNKYPNAQVIGYKGSTANYEDMVNLWNNAYKEFGNIDIWINNAGVDQERKKVWEVNVSSYTQVICVNVIGVMNGSKIAFNQMLKQGYGQIFNMEGFGSDGMKQDKMAIYGTSKRAVRYFTQSLSKEAKGTPIKVGTLSPGMVLTDFLLKSVKEDNEDAKQAKKIFNILADDVDTVTTFLAKGILNNDKNNAHIAWLTNTKVTFRFLTAKLTKRKVIE